MRKATSAAAVLGSLLAVLAPTVAAASSAPDAAVVETGCLVYAPVVDVDADRLAPFVPEQFALQTNVPQHEGLAATAQIQIGAVRCQHVSIGGDDLGSATWVFLRALLRTNPAGDADAPGEFNNYELFMASNNRRQVGFFVGHGADPQHMLYAPDLVFDTVHPGQVSINSGDQVPSPFHITDAAAMDRIFVLPSLTGQLWGAGARGWWERGPDDVINNIRFGRATGTVTAPDPDSDLNYIFGCDGEQTFDDVGGHALFERSDYSVRQHDKQTSETTAPTCS